MNKNGNEIIDAICKRLEDQGKTCHDYQILNVLRGLDRFELAQLLSFGDVDSWVRERNAKKQSA